MTDKKRSTWKDRRCSHGKPVEWRTQYDVATCNTPGCFDAAMAKIGYVPKAALVAACSSLADARLVLDEVGRMFDFEQRYLLAELPINEAAALKRLNAVARNTVAPSPDGAR